MVLTFPALPFDKMQAAGDLLQNIISERLERNGNYQNEKLGSFIILLKQTWIPARTKISAHNCDLTVSDYVEQFEGTVRGDFRMQTDVWTVLIYKIIRY